ncbi:MAG: DNA-directed RNA polymerase subunit beta' [Parcubacteria group bacterium]|nr:DNA-directed RNA polymerase subunit beta' [Parcubacteria group bacterium]
MADQKIAIDLEAIRLKVASPDDILNWSRGEVTKPETINYRTQKPEKDGLFDERIFGPTKDWECYCGKYRRVRYKGVVCDRCGVEVTRSIVRRERFGHIELAVPVSHIWFLRGVPSKIGAITGLSVIDLEKIIYFTGYIVTKIHEEAKNRILEDLEAEYKTKAKQIKKQGGLLASLKSAKEKTEKELKALKVGLVLSEVEYRNLSLKYGPVFEAGTGSETLRDIVSKINLENLKIELETESRTASAEARRKILKRLFLTRSLIKAGIRPEWMFLVYLPIIPPDLRPMVPLDGGRYATSDLNDLYRRVLNRNSRLKKLIELNAPEVIVRNEKRMLQEAVDALIDNSQRRGEGVVTVASTGQKRPLKSLADILKGKQGRFRQNLLGKRVDYSGRSVIVVGPELDLHQCGLPKKMALELFKPFVIRELIKKESAHNIRGALRLIEEGPDEVWAILEEIIQGKLVLLNRAPTLHRLGIQAFQPILIEGEAIRVHPMVCRAFNADFDGDQMAVHLPLSEEAQAEAREIMLSSKNLLKPATGDPITVPTQDIVLGCYYLTKISQGVKGEGKIFGSEDEAILVYQHGGVDLKAKIKVRKKGKLIETSVGRIIFNQALPPDFEFANKELNSKGLEALVGQIIIRYSEAPSILDKIKKIGFEYATKSGITWGMNDLIVPSAKKILLAEAETEVEKIFNQYQRGLLTDEERYSRVIEIWSKVKEKVGDEVKKSLDPNGSVFSIISSGARGSWTQPIQMSGMKGLVVNPAGQIIELPIKRSYKEGFNALEYFIATHGARKGTTDTALKTAHAGYLTRRLVDVAQDLIVTQEDCGTTGGWKVYREDGEVLGRNFAARLAGRILAETVMGKKGKIIGKEGDLVVKELAEEIDQSGANEVILRSPITCKSLAGVCSKCYGYDLGSNKIVPLGTAVGVIAAQAIGEPGTQLTMRTFHTGGVASGSDITQGLPRVEELFEARPPKGQAIISEISGIVLDIIDKRPQKIIKIQEIDEEKNKKKPEVVEYAIPGGTAIIVEKGTKVQKGDSLSEGSVDPSELFKLAGSEKTQRYILNEVQKIYVSQGAPISDKHVEIIIRQMFSRVKVKEEGDSIFTVGEIIPKAILLEENHRLKEEGKEPAKGAQLLLGITKTALTTDSFLSAASFQETSRILISASTKGAIDKLKGLKENVIIGRLIPVGTGFKK